MPLRKGRKPGYLPVGHDAMTVCAFMKYAVFPLRISENVTKLSLCCTPGMAFVFSAKGVNIV